MQLHERQTAVTLLREIGDMARADIGRIVEATRRTRQEGRVTLIQVVREPTC